MTRLSSIPWMWYLFGSAFAVLLAILCEPAIQSDDAAITYRYVSRLASGQGFTYNDHEHVLGASNPLYVLLLAGFHLSGLDIERAAALVGILCFALCTALAMYIAARLAGLPAGILTGLLLPIEGYFLYQCLSGLEVALAAFLGLLFMALLLMRRPVPAAIVLGLAVFNKLDAGMLALAFALAWVLEHRTLPWKIAGVSFLVLSPWLLFSSLYFGSPIPNSALTKFAEHTKADFNHLWVLDILMGNPGRFALLLLALGSLAFYRRLKGGERICYNTLLAWLLMYGSGYSMVDLGGYFPWYLTVLFPPLVILASVFLSRCSTTLLSWATARITLPPSLVLAVAWLPSLLLVAWVGEKISQPIRARINTPVTGVEAFDADRRMAGIFISQYGQRNEVVNSAFGWVAYEVENPFNDRSGLNTREQLEPVSYWVKPGPPWYRGVKPPPALSGFIPVASFRLADEFAERKRWFTVFGHPDSQVVKAGKRFLQLRLFELPSQELLGDLRTATLQGNDLLTPAPSGMAFRIAYEKQPIHLVFTPVLKGGRNAAVAFQVKVDGVTQYELQVSPSNSGEPMAIPLNGGEGSASEVALRTLPVPDRELGQEAVWRNVKVVVGDAWPDLERLKNERLIQIWRRYTPLDVQDYSE